MDQAPGRPFITFTVRRVLSGNATTLGRGSITSAKCILKTPTISLRGWHTACSARGKINHALLLGGSQGIGKDTLIEPVRHAVGPWNFFDISPQELLGRFNGFCRSVIVRLNEARDLGDYDRYALYEHLKPLTAAPPDTLRVDEKNLREYSIVNCVGVVITTNNRTDGIHLPADDRAIRVGGHLGKRRLPPDQWEAFGMVRYGGFAHVTAYLGEFDLSTSIRRRCRQRRPHSGRLSMPTGHRKRRNLHLLDDLENPPAKTLGRMQDRANGHVGDWIKDRKTGGRSRPTGTLRSRPGAQPRCRGYVENGANAR